MKDNKQICHTCSKMVKKIVFVDSKLVCPDCAKKAQDKAN